MSTDPKGILLIGVGNDYRNDDAVGLVVARRLREQAIEGMNVLEASGEGAELMELWQQATGVIVVDAVESGVAPGTVHRLDASASPLPSRFFHCSTHAFSVAEAVELARTLGQLPPRLIVYGIEGKSFAAGKGLSPEVDAAATAVIPQLLEELGTLARGGSCA